VRRCGAKGDPLAFSDGSLGQPPLAYHAVLPFKILVLQTLDNLVEKQLTRDRISFLPRLSLKDPKLVIRGTEGKVERATRSRSHP
jgi:hypothetical protein